MECAADSTTPRDVGGTSDVGGASDGTLAVGAYFRLTCVGQRGNDPRTSRSVSCQRRLNGLGVGEASDGERGPRDHAPDAGAARLSGVSELGEVSLTRLGDTPVGEVEGEEGVVIRVLHQDDLQG